MLIEKEKGFSLIEVLVSLSIISFILLLVSGFFVNSATHNSRLDKDYSAMQIAESLLHVYKTKPFSELEHISTPKEINLSEELNFSVDDSLYTAFVSIKKHPDNLLKDRVLVVKVTVSHKNSNHPFTLEGLVKR